MSGKTAKAPPRRRSSPLNAPDGIQSALGLQPLRLEDLPADLSELASELVSKSGGLGRGLSARTKLDLSSAIRIVNSYYSNKMEGVFAHPQNIEQMLEGELAEEDPKKRIMTGECVAHVRVQEEMDLQAEAGTLPDPSSPDYIKHLHAGLYRGTDEELRVQELNGEVFFFEPGEWRDHYVKVGEHVPPAPERVDAAMNEFHSWYRESRPRRQLSRVGNLGCAHQRMAHIHPFPDGNGRMTRLMSHAMCHKAGVVADSLWSLSRGLASGLQGGETLKPAEQYLHYVAAADGPPRGAADGTNLSLTALVDFARWFLKVCIDQVDYMRSVLDPEVLTGRLERQAHADGLKEPHASLLRMLLEKGEVEKCSVKSLLELPAGSAAQVMDDLAEKKLIGAGTSPSSISLRFPARAHPVLFPELI